MASFLRSPSGGGGPRSPSREQTTPSSMKKKQSSLKVCVQSFAKLIVSWQRDVELICQLLHRMHGEQKAVESVYSVAAYRDTRRLAAFERFPHLEQRLVAKLAKDVESDCNLIKQTMHGLGDVLAAMQMTSHDALQMTLNEPPGIFPSDAIFTVDHVLDIQQLQTQFALEYSRKQELIDSVLSLGDRREASPRATSPAVNSDSNLLLPRAAINACVEIFHDESSETFINRAEVSAYLATNSGSVQMLADHASP